MSRILIDAFLQSDGANAQAGVDLPIHFELAVRKNMDPFSQHLWHHDATSISIFDPRHFAINICHRYLVCASNFMFFPFKLFSQKYPLDMAVANMESAVS